MSKTKVDINTWYQKRGNHLICNRKNKEK